MKFFGEILYIAFSLVLWVGVEFLTVWRMRFEEWMSLMPWVLLQYLFIILVFWFFLFVKQWSHRKTFILLVIVMYIFEFLWHNPLLLNVVWFIPASILLLQIWGFLTFVPFWLVTRSAKQHKKVMIFYCLWPALGFVMALLS